MRFFFFSFISQSFIIVAHSLSLLSWVVILRRSSTFGTFSHSDSLVALSRASFPSSISANSSPMSMRS